MVAILASRRLPGSSVDVWIGQLPTGETFYQVDIDGDFYDGDYCDVAEGIDFMVNPFGVTRVISSAEGYDAVDKDFEQCYTRV